MAVDGLSWEDAWSRLDTIAASCRRNDRLINLPDPHDVETVLEVGAWTWNYMEPVLGTASFVLLAAQFARSQMLNLRLRPYTHSVKSRRADIVAKEFPMFDKRLIRDYVMSSDISHLNHSRCPGVQKFFLAAFIVAVAATTSQ